MTYQNSIGSDLPLMPGSTVVPLSISGLTIGKEYSVHGQTTIENMAASSGKITIVLLNGRTPVATITHTVEAGACATVPYSFSGTAIDSSFSVSFTTPISVSLDAGASLYAVEYNQIDSMPVATTYQNSIGSDLPLMPGSTVVPLSISGLTIGKEYSVHGQTTIENMAASSGKITIVLLNGPTPFATVTHTVEAGACATVPYSFSGTAIDSSFSVSFTTPITISLDAGASLYAVEYNQIDSMPVATTYQNSIGSDLPLMPGSTVVPLSISGLTIGKEYSVHGQTTIENMAAFNGKITIVLLNGPTPFATVTHTVEAGACATVPYSFSGTAIDSSFSVSFTTPISISLDAGASLYAVEYQDIAIVELGDVNQDGVVNLLDVDFFIDRLSTGTYQAEADCNEDGEVNLLDIDPFIAILGGG